jgi:phosphate transport system substrate-binding protein
MKRILGPLALFMLCALTAAPRALAAEARITGAGATFPQPLYERWVAEFGKVKPGARVDYQGIGSGGGIKAILDGTVAFAGSDAPMTKKELEAGGGADAFLQIPMCAGAVVLIYNLPGAAPAPPLNMSGEVLTDVFLGRISRWSDRRIAALNPGVKLPDLAIVPAWRTDGSGTTFVFTSWLAGQSESFKTTVGLGKQVAWPTGQGGKGNPGVAAVVQQTPGAIGYVELNYATANKLPFAAVKNSAGAFVRAGPAAVAAAAEAAAPALAGQSLVANLWEQPSAAAYPIASFSYAIVYKDLRNLRSADEAKTLAAFLWWAVHDGQAHAAAMDYAPLSPAVQKKVEDALRLMTHRGKPVLPGAT